MDSTPLSVSQATKHVMLDTARWARTLAFIMLVGVSLSALFFLLSLIASRKDMDGFFGVFAFLVSAITIAAHIYPLRQLFNYRNHMRLANLHDDSAELHLAALCIRNFFRYIVIAIIICIVLYMLIFIAMLLLVGF